MATKAIITDYGRNQIAQALAGDYKIIIKSLVYGDGNGSVYDPVASQTTLLHQLGAVDTIGRAEAGAWTYFYSEIPPDVHGIVIREIGITDISDNLLVVATVPSAELVQPEGGVLQRLPIRFGVTTSIGNVLIVQAPTTLPIFNNETLGIIQGNKADGFVYRREEDEELEIGYGAVYGWDNTFKKVSDESQIVESFTIYVTGTGADIQDDTTGNLAEFWRAESDQITIGNTDTHHLHFNSNYPADQVYGDHITATTPEGEKAIAWLDDVGQGITGIATYSVVSGEVSSLEEPKFAYVVDNRVGIKAGTKYADSANIREIPENIELEVDTRSGQEFNIYMHYDTEIEEYSLIAKSNVEYRQMQRPENANDGDYWLRTFEPLEAYWINKSDTGEYSYEFTNDVFMFKTGYDSIGTRYIEYTGTITTDIVRRTVSVPDTSTIVLPVRYTWEVLGSGTITLGDITRYSLNGGNTSMIAVMPDYAWNGYHVNMRNLQGMRELLLPSFEGHENHILMCDGTKAYWAALPITLYRGNY